MCLAVQFLSLSFPTDKIGYLGNFCRVFMFWGTLGNTAENCCLLGKGVATSLSVITQQSRATKEDK